MKNVLLILLGLVLGVGIVKGTWEYSNIRQIKLYNPCVETAINSPVYNERRMSGYQQCKHLLTPTRLEAAILWQPNLWCKYDSLGCE